MYIRKPKNIAAPMNMIPRTFEIVVAAVPPPGTFQTTTAIAITIAKLRRFLLRSTGPQL
jgi:hypothetical protein